jgi:peroxiredoxin
VSPRIGVGRKTAAWLVSFVAAAACALGTASSLVGKEAPDFVLRGLDGRNLRLSEYRGQVVLLNFWARWAGDSRREMPALERINATYGRAGLVVIGVSVDEDARRVGDFAGSMGVSYPVLLDSDGGTGRAYSIKDMPLTILVDRAGIVRYSNVGFKRGDENSYLDEIRALLRE